MIQYCFFDLDGTVTDSVTDIAASMNWALEQIGLPTFAPEAYCQKAGRGMDNLCRACLPAGQEERLDALRALYHDRYARHCCDHTALYPGLLSSLEQLRRAGKTLAVVSNKPQSQADVVAAAVLGDCGFVRVMGKQDRFPIKPDPASLLWLMGQLGAAPEESVYIGDSDVDIQLGKNAGLRTVGACWGFRGEAELRAAGAEVLAQRPDELGTIILQLK